MCGGGGGNSSGERQQALSSRVRQGELDMISRVNRGLEIRRLLTPEEIAAKKLQDSTVQGYGGDVMFATIENNAAKSEDPTFE